MSPEWELRFREVEGKEGWEVIKEEGGQNLGTFGMRDRVETGLTSGAEVLTDTGRACSRHCQKDGDKTLPLHLSLLEGQQGSFLDSHTLLWDLGRVGSGWERGKAAGAHGVFP